MATYYVWSGATGTNAGTSWTNAYTAFGSAVSAATLDGDIIKVHYTHQEPSLAGDTTYTFLNNVRVFSVNKDSSDALTAMGTSGWLGNLGVNRSITFAGAFEVYIYGVTVLISGGTQDSITIGSSDGSHFELENCFLQIDNTSGTASNVVLGSDTSNSYVRLVNTTLEFSKNWHGIVCRSARIELEGCNISSGGVPGNTLFKDSSVNIGGPDVVCIGCDFSFITTGTLVGNLSNYARTIKFIQCKLGAGVTVLAAQSNSLNKASGIVYLFDCSSGDNHGIFGYYDAFGSCVTDTGIYFTSGAAGQSWKITTTANCSYYTPFVSPFVDWYNTSTTTITPYFEIGNVDAEFRKNDEVWAEFFVKTTSGSTKSTMYNDRMTLLSTPVNQVAGAGISAWTGTIEGSQRLDSGVSVTPQEVGHIRGRVCVGEPSITVYLDPQIRI